ncbi:MAG: alpha/beta fold hydrolase [Cytophagaceae bacterium]|nr:alpha/beta fold hydrolase [Cytophagaceae bacterium]
MKRLLFLFTLPVLLGSHAFAQQRFADLGDFKLENGQTIQACKLGYRTFGQLNAERSNAVLVPTWFTGSSQQKSFVAAPGGIADSTNYFTIVVDALGNGVSSSPSNSVTQPGKAFPAVSIRDMVRSQYELLNRLKISHLYAVTGISMGGMQSFQWLVSYPDFMDKVVPIIGSPKQSSYDKILWNSELKAIERAGDCATCEATAMKTVGAIHLDHLYTPAWHQRELKAEDYEGRIANVEEDYAKLNAQDWACQLRAMLTHDIYQGRPMAEIKPLVKAKLLVVVATQDHMVNPQAAMDLAKFLSAPLVELTSDCGHMATGCEGKKLAEAVNGFLAK